MNEKGGAGVKIPRFMLAAPNSGSGKTLITCGLLQALKNRGGRRIETAEETSDSGESGSDKGCIEAF